MVCLAAVQSDAARRPARQPQALGTTCPGPHATTARAPRAPTALGCMPAQSCGVHRARVRWAAAAPRPRGPLDRTSSRAAGRHRAARWVCTGCSGGRTRVQTYTCGALIGGRPGQAGHPSVHTAAPCCGPCISRRCAGCISHSTPTHSAAPPAARPPALRPPCRHLRAAAE